MGRILENAHGNIAGQLRTPHGQFFTGESQEQQPQIDVWAAGSDPWSNAAQQTHQYATVPQPANNPWEHWQGSVAHQPAQSSQSSAFHGQTPNDYDANTTDTETSSDDAEPDYSDPIFQGMTPTQIDEHLFWAYKTAKKVWRRHLQKPTRRVRHHLQKKGKGKGRGKSRFSFLADMPDALYDEIFFGGKGKSKGKARTSGKGKGRRVNPRGRDGQIMTCGICGSESHFRADCPQNPNRSNNAHHAFASGTQPNTTFTSYSGLGPLGDLLANEPSAAFITFQSDNIPRLPQAPPPATTQVLPAERPEGIWGTSTPVASGNVDSHFDNAFSTVPIPYEGMFSLFRPAATTPTNMHLTTDAGEHTGTNVPIPEDLDPLGQLLQHRSAVVESAYQSGMPQPTVQLQEPNMPNPGMAHLSHFSMLDDFRRTQALSQAQRTSERPTPAWQHLGTPPGLANVGTFPVNAAPQLFPAHFMQFASSMQQHQASNEERITSQRRARRERAAQQAFRRYGSGEDLVTQFATETSAVAESPPTHTQESDSNMHSAETDETFLCTICQERVQDGDSISTLACQHSFHQECADAWAAMQINTNRNHLPSLPS